jgi:thiol-disulfide isomerase/thioredoxin
MSKDSESFSVAPIARPDAPPRMVRTRGLALGCLLGAPVGVTAMLFAGYRVGNRATHHGPWWSRILEPATEVAPVPPPLDAPGCRPGDVPPPLPRDGWIHGSAPRWEDFAGRVVVVDAWGDWCPYCDAFAPELAAVCRAYEHKGVAMLGLTGDDRPTAEDFCARHGFSGLVACDAEKYLTSWLSDKYPTLLVIGRDGRVVWNDGSARFGHRTEELAKELSQAIERAL